MRITVAAGLFLFLAFALAVPASAQWQVRAGGNSLHDGFVAATGPLSPQVRWQAPMPAWFGQPVFVEGNIVVTTWLRDAPMAERGVVVACRLDTGDTLWTRTLPFDFPTDWSGYACAMRDGRVFATRAGNSNASYLYALDAGTGSILWRSQDLIDIYVSEGPAFTASGDLLVGNSANVARINAATGARVYLASRGGSMSGGREPVVVGDRYYIRAGGVGDRVAAYDIDTGQFRYWSDSIGGAQSGLFATADGTIYAPTGNLIAFTDTGSALARRWTSAPLAYSPFSTFAVGPDGSVYSYKVIANSVAVVRLDRLTGLELSVSPPVQNGTSIIPGHMAVDANGTLFVTNMDADLYSFNPDLSLRWRETVPRSEGGPSLAADGTLLVSGNTGLFAFAPGAAAIASSSAPAADWHQSRCSPNPFRRATSIEFDLPAAAFVALTVYNPAGREVRTLVQEPLGPGSHRVTFDASGFPSGVYFYRLTADDQVDTRRILLLK